MRRLFACLVVLTAVAVYPFVPRLQAVTTLFSAQFTVATADADIAGYGVDDDATFIGTACAEWLDTSGGNAIFWYNAGDTAYGQANSNSHRIAYLCTPLPTSDDYNISLKRTAGTGDDDVSAIIFGRSTDDYCVVWWRGSAAAAEDIGARLWSGGSPTTLGTDVDAGMANGDTVYVHIRSGGVVTVDKGASALISFTNSACVATREWGFGFGNFTNGTDDISNAVEVDDLLVTQEDAVSTVRRGPLLGVLP